MLKIVEMQSLEQLKLLEEMNFGHLACSQEDQPYIVPMNYAYDGENIFILTTEGMKTQWMNVNPKICFQIEQVSDQRHWQSVIVMGYAELLTHSEDIGRAAHFIVKKNPLLTPAFNKTILSGEERSGGAAVYRIHVSSMSGHKTVVHI